MPALGYNPVMQDSLLEWLFSKQRFGINPSLDRINALLERLGHPQKSFRCVLVGGTNGKGSTAATLASILNTSGITTGLFTSPHLTYFSERFWVQGYPLGEAFITSMLHFLKPFAEEIGATFFEITTALGCLLFADADVKLAVMEVGVGGRFDATNALDPELSIITGIALDHVQYLGDTLEKIAFEKSGIMRANRVCLTGARGEALDVLEQQAKVKGASLLSISKDIQTTLKSMTWNGTEVHVKNTWGDLTVQSPLLGLHQVNNLALAVSAAQVLGASESVIQRGVKETKWPGRLEVLSYKDRKVILDGAHNPDAAKIVKETLEALNDKPVTLIFGVAQDKDIVHTLKPLEDLAQTVIFTKALQSPRAARPSDLAKLSSQTSMVVEDPREAIEKAVEITQDGIILVAGSLYLIGEVRPYLLKQDLEPFERYQ
jgi:dihydrofolate synthase/folylpolyglutamate synthase